MLFCFSQCNNLPSTNPSTDALTWIWCSTHIPRPTSDRGLSHCVTCDTLCVHQSWYLMLPPHIYAGAKCTFIDCRHACTVWGGWNQISKLIFRKKCRFQFECWNLLEPGCFCLNSRRPRRWRWCQVCKYCRLSMWSGLQQKVDKRFWIFQYSDIYRLQYIKIFQISTSWNVDSILLRSNAWTGE